MVFQMLLIIWLSTGPEYSSSGMLASQDACRDSARVIVNAYPRGTIRAIDLKCILGYEI